MLIHVAAASGRPKSTVRCYEMIAMHARSSSGLHQLTDDPATAELILLCGDLESLADAQANQLARRFPDKTFAYSEIDALIPYLPGVYGSAAKPGRLDLRLDLGRTQGGMYFSRYGSSMNPEVRHRPNEPKDLLFCFRGRRDCRVRANLIDCPWNRPDIEVLETTGFMHWQHGIVGKQQAQKDYADALARSHFALCPRGMGFGSIRLFEVMEMGIAPVLLADRYSLPPGPDWASFLIQVPERDFAHLPRILEAYVGESATRGRRAREAWERFYAPELIFDHLIAQLVLIRRQNRVPQRRYRPWLYLYANARPWLGQVLRRGRSHRAPAAGPTPANPPGSNQAGDGPELDSQS
jgi:hypothetical protein